MADDQQMIRLASLWERRGQRGKGRRYLTGYLGHARVVIFENTDKKSDADPDWVAFIATPKPKRKARNTRQDADGPSGSGATSQAVWIATTARFGRTLRTRPPDVMANGPAAGGSLGDRANKKPEKGANR